MQNRFKQIFETLLSLVDEIDDISDIKELLAAIREIERFIDGIQTKLIKKKVVEFEEENIF